jgi:hypothetical protein
VRIAAGVVWIILSIWAGLGSLVFFAGGAVATAGGTVMAEAAKDLDKATPMNAKAAADATKLIGDMKGAGGAMMGWGIYVLVTAILAFVGAILFFVNKAKTFLFIVSILVLGLVAGFVVTPIPFGIGEVVYLVGGLLGILGATKVGETAAA